MKQNYTKLRVYDVFERMLEKKHFSDISTTELCDAADISRTTFYRLFEDKYDLMRSFYYQGIEHIFALNMSHEDTATSIHRYMQNKRELLQNLLKHDQEHSFEKYIFKLTCEYYVTLVEKKSGQKTLAPEVLMDIEMYTAAANYAWKKWINASKAIPLTVLYEQQNRLVPKSIRPYLGI